VCFYVYVRPALRAMLGLKQVHLPVVTATAAETIRTAEGLTEFTRCTLTGEPGAYVARSTGSQSSGVMRSMSLGDGLLIAPPEVTAIEAGSPVRVLLLDGASVLTPPV
jgi:molybdopterin molybdotransferase